MYKLIFLFLISQKKKINFGKTDENSYNSKFFIGILWLLAH